MPNQKLLEAIHCFSPKEKKRLRHFVDSPYHNHKFNRAKISHLLDHILDNTLSELGEGGLSEKEALNALFFPDHPFKIKGKNPIDSLASDLFSLVRQFILTEDMASERSKGREQLAMARFYRKHNLEPRFWYTIQQFRKYQSDQKIKDENYYQLIFKLEEEIAVFQSIFNTYTDDSNLIAANIALDNYYAIAKSEFATLLSFQKVLANIEVENALQLSDYLFEIFPSYKALHSPLTILYHQIIQLLKNPADEAAMTSFAENTARYEPVIPKDKYRNIMAYYRNISGRFYHLTSNRQALFKALFPLYKEHLEKGYFHVIGTDKILPGSLKVLTNIALRVNESKWAKQLLTDYPEKRIAGTKYPVEAHSLCLAEVLFFEDKYEEALRHLVYRNFENVNYSILADVLLIKIYFVTKNELIESRISALGQKIRRSKITSANQKQYLNFLKMVAQIQKLQWTSSIKKREGIGKKIDDLSPLIERGWLKLMLENA